MRRYSAVKDGIFMTIGLILLLAGMVLIKGMADAQGLMRAFPYICVGVGTGMFGHNMGNILKNLAVKNDPKTAREIEIETWDERNVIIRNRAKAKAYDLMIMAFGALLLTFALMQVDLYAVIMLAATYLLVVFSSAYYMSKFRKEM